MPTFPEWSAADRRAMDDWQFPAPTAVAHGRLFRRTPFITQLEIISPGRWSRTTARSRVRSIARRNMRDPVGQ